jgi:ABC-type multidrug transport system fused ATPase/permease subunit
MPMDLSSALDVETEQILWDQLCAQPGTTVLAVSQRRAAWQRADRIIVLQDGRVVGEGGRTICLFIVKNRVMCMQANIPDK